MQNYVKLAISTFRATIHSLCVAQRNIEIEPRVPAYPIEAVQRYFAGAAEYARLYESSSACGAFFNERLRIVTDIVETLKNGTVLDLGCGPGILLSRLKARNFDLFGLDCCPEMITEAKKRVGEDANLVVGHAEESPFEDQTFDAVLALGVLEYLPDVTQGLKEIARVAKPNGVIVVSMLNALSLYRSWERFVYSPASDSWLQRHGKRDSTALLRLHTRKSLFSMMKTCHLEPTKIRYYDANVCVPPFDLEFPASTRKLNEWIKAHIGRWSFSLVHTAFILRAKKATTLARAA